MDTKAQPEMTERQIAFVNKLETWALNNRDVAQASPIRMAIASTIAMIYGFFCGFSKIKIPLAEFKRDMANLMAAHISVQTICDPSSNTLPKDDYGDIVVISGPSGCGKDYLIRNLREQDGKIGLSVSCTTRPKGKHKDGTPEIEGVDYHFLENKQTFLNKARNGEFIEWTEYLGELYGTPRAEIIANRDQGRDITILNLDANGALGLQKLYPKIITIFILPPSADELLSRLVNRKRESMEEIEKRIKDAPNQIMRAHEYDIIIMNDNADEAVKEIQRVLEFVRNRSADRSAMINTVLNSFNNI